MKDPFVKDVEVVERFGILGSKRGKDGETFLELRSCKWFGHDPMFDLRWWYGDDIPGKGLTLTGGQALQLYKTLAKQFGGDDVVPDRAG